MVLLLINLAFQMFHWSSDSYLMCMCERLTGWPDQNHQSDVAPPEWECWEPSCRLHRRSAAADRERERQKVLDANVCRYTETQGLKCVNNEMTT